MGFFSYIGNKLSNAVSNVGSKARPVAALGAKMVAGATSAANAGLNLAEKAVNVVKDIPIVGTAMKPVTTVAEGVINVGRKGVRAGASVGNVLEKVSKAKDMKSSIDAVKTAEREFRKS